MNIKTDGKGRYAELIMTLMQHPGQWVSIPATDVPGKTSKAKRHNLAGACKSKGMQISTRTLGSDIYLSAVPLPAESSDEGDIPYTITARRFDDLLHMVRAYPGQWVSAPLGKLPGSGIDAKRVGVHQDARARHLAVRVTIQEGKLYTKLRLRKGEKLPAPIAPLPDEKFYRVERPSQAKEYRRFDSVLAAVQSHPSQWIAISLADLSGNTTEQKRGGVCNAARVRNLAVRTRIRDEKVYVMMA